MSTIQVKDANGATQSAALVPGTGTGVSVADSLPVVVRQGVYQEDTPHTSGDFGFFLLGMRSDSDVPTAGDGEYTAFKLDEAGRLKVASQPASYPLISGDITAVAGTVNCDVRRTSNVMIQMVASALAGHNSSFEGSLNSTDGVDGTWFSIQAVRSNANTVEVATGVLAATPTYAWELSVNGLSWLRVKATAHTSGTATYFIQRGTYATEPVPAIQSHPVSLTGTNLAIVGQGAESSAAAGNAVRVGGRVRTAVDTTLAANDAADMTMTASGALLVQAHAVPEAKWQFSGTLTTTTDTSAKALVTGQRNYVTDISYQNAGATSSRIVVKDGATVIWKGNAPANMAVPASITLCSPLRGTAATAINVAALTAGADIDVNLCGFTGL